MEKIIPIIIAAAVSLVVGIVIGVIVRRVVAEGKIGSAEKEAARIIEKGKSDAEAIQLAADNVRKEADARKKEALVEAKEEIFQLKNEADREIKERRKEISAAERRITQKEETIDKKNEALERKNETLDRKIKENELEKEKIAELIVAQNKKLEEVAGYSAEQAKAELISRIEAEIKDELAQKMIDLEAQFKDEADKKARNIISLAIQRCAADHVSEATISVVPLPNEEMKGRIIGREGRNIQKIETLTGVELIIDDTPEAITLSGFDPVRREIARLSLEKLISDGRIHPARIEEMVEKSRKEVEASVKQAGEKAVLEVGVHGINPELVRLLGRMRYRTSYGQNALQHSVEVAFLSGIIADELGVDSTLARRAGLLHDIGKAFPHDVEGSHVQIGVEAARKYKESKEVIHAIEAHHNDVDPQTVIAIIVQAADAISAARPGARREDLENYIKRLRKLEEIATEFAGVDKAYAIQAGREIRVMVKPEEVTDQGMALIAHDIAQKIQSEVKYPGQIKINLIRESRAVDYAK
ncbi:MAG: ribonuclease Y [Clostridia bacterium]|nr:ribonuclease Y [Clostridia bacterium]